MNTLNTLILSTLTCAFITACGTQQTAQPIDNTLAETGEDSGSLDGSDYSHDGYSSSEDSGVQNVQGNEGGDSESYPDDDNSDDSGDDTSSGDPKDDNETHNDKEVDVDIGIECYCPIVSEDIPSASDGTTEEVLVVVASIPSDWDGSANGVQIHDSQHMGPDSADMIWWKSRSNPDSTTLSYPSNATNLVVFACDGQGFGTCDATSTLRIVSSVIEVLESPTGNTGVVNVGVSQPLAETDGTTKPGMEQKTWFGK